jgi:hypothetical protein
MAPELNLPNPDPKWLGSLLPSLCFGKSSLAQLRAEPLIPALCTALSAEQRTALEQLAPERITLPSGRRARLTYRQDAPPLLAAPVQELFGLADTPRILGGRAAVLIDLLAPNRRPVQRTQDLPQLLEHDLQRGAQGATAALPQTRVARRPLVRTTNHAAPAPASLTSPVSGRGLRRIGHAFYHADTCLNPTMVASCRVRNRLAISALGSLRHSVEAPQRQTPRVPPGLSQTAPLGHGARSQQ